MIGFNHDRQVSALLVQLFVLALQSFHYSSHVSAFLHQDQHRLNKINTIQGTELIRRTSGLEHGILSHQRKHSRHIRRFYEEDTSENKREDPPPFLATRRSQRKANNYLFPRSLMKEADTFLENKSSIGNCLLNNSVRLAGSSSSAPVNRRIFMGAALLGTSIIPTMPFASYADISVDAITDEATATQTATTIATAKDTKSTIEKADYLNQQIQKSPQQSPPKQQEPRSYFGKLEWESTPVNKRTGVTLFDAEKAGYNVRFVTYLARFLLVFDYDCQRWWYSRAADIPPLSSAEQVEAIRLKQFGAFSASVEVGLQDYAGNYSGRRGRRALGSDSNDDDDVDGPLQLMEALLERYCPTIDSVRAEREERGLPPLTEQGEAKELREIKEAKRQIALLFGLLEETQPVEALNKLLASIDNGSITFVKIEDGGSGYAPGYGPPRVEFPPPKAGDDYKVATGRAILQPNGQILRIDLENRGFGYSSPPSVTISPPGADRGVTIPGAEGATATAYIFKSGVNKGRLERIQIDNPGKGYMEGEKIRVLVSPPELPLEDGGVKATATAVLEYEVGGIDVIDGGTGYAVEKQLPVYIDPPPLTARINMNDPLMARIIDPSKPLPPTTIPTPQQRGKLRSITNSSDPNSFTYLVNRLASNNGLGGGGGCIGRACYDRPVIAMATATAESSSFTTFRNATDARKIVEAEVALMKYRMISATSGGSDSQLPAFWNGGPSSSSGQLLTLLPPGIGLEYNNELKRFVLSTSPDFIDINKESTQFSGSALPLDPEFGPRGRSPVERDLQLDFGSFIRFCASGAVCASGVHLLLTPLDVVKTKIQTDPENYPEPITAFKKLVADQGISSFFSGWVPTFIGFFCWGGFSYSLAELVRRYLNDVLGPQAPGLEIPIILAASTVSATVGTYILVPFESVRIRSVAQPGYGKNVFDVTARIVKEEGIASLFSAAPPFLLKEIPFTMAKFTVFTLMTRSLYQRFPAAQEDIQLSLLVSLASGIVGGAIAAVVSNPADATISEMKKNKSGITSVQAAQGLIDKGGYANLMRGLPVRMAFYPLVVSLQFLVYDAVRIYLGVGADDLKVYLDVLGGALKKGGSVVGPV